METMRSGILWEVRFGWEKYRISVSSFVAQGRQSVSGRMVYTRVFSSGAFLVYTQCSLMAAE